MKRTLLTLLITAAVILGGSTPIYADGIALRVSHVQADLGETITVPVSLISQGQVAAVQFDLSYNEELITCTRVEKGTFTADFSLVSNKDGNKQRVLIYRTDLKPIAAGTGSIAEFVFSVKSPVAAGADGTLRLNNIVLSDLKGNRINTSMAVENGLVTVETAALAGDTTASNSGDNSATTNQGSSVSSTPSSTTAANNNTVPAAVQSDKLSASNSAGNTSTTAPGSSASSTPSSTTAANNNTVPVAIQSDKSSAPNHAVILKDIKAHWAEKTIEKYVGMGVLKGYADGTFKPDKSITRAEFVTVINHVNSFEAAPEFSSFTDVKTTDWYAREVSIAKRYISGYPGGIFNPNKNISRLEATVIISRATDSAASPAGLDVLKQFRDSDGIPSWGKQAVANAVARGYLNGYSDHTLQLDKPITRAEALNLIENTVNN